MITANVSRSADLSARDIDEFFVGLDRFLFSLARRWIPYEMIPADVLDLEIDELVQQTRIKLWLALQKEHITNLQAYIRKIAYHESVNIARQYKRTVPLICNEEGELCLDEAVLPAAGKGGDPSSEFERQEEIIASAQEAVSGVLTLPPRQRQAVLCVLKELIADSLPIVDIFRTHGLDIEAADWSNQKEEIVRLRASLSLARKRLRARRARSQQEQASHHTLEHS
ncbi:MAG TPA: hypothetical protein VGF67_31170 [Ktedonobacteraceae bacterium]